MLLCLAPAESLARMEVRKIALQRISLDELAPEERLALYGNQISEQNVKALVGRCLSSGSKIGVTFLTASEVIVATGVVVRTTESGFGLQEEGGEVWDIAFANAMKAYAIPGG